MNSQSSGPPHTEAGMAATGPSEAVSPQVVDAGGMAAWLEHQGVSLVVSAGKANRLVSVAQRGGGLECKQAVFDQPMAVHADKSGVLVGSRWQLWQLKNLLQEGQSYRRCDALLTPLQARTLGEVKPSDFVRCGEDTHFVSSLYNCVAKLTTEPGFEVVWMPPFVTSVVAEDRCHLSGLALTDDKPAFATAYAHSDVGAGWRSQTQNGGLLIHCESGEILVDALSMPRAPRLHEGVVWFLESGNGSLNRWQRTGGHSVVAKLPGLARALQLHAGYAVIATSRLRTDEARAVPVGRRLNNNGVCGVHVVELATGNIVGSASLEGLEELDGIGVLAGIQRPWIAGLESRVARGTVVVHHDGRRERHHVTVVEESGVEPLSGAERELEQVPSPGASDPRAVARERSYRASASLAEHQVSGEASTKTGGMAEMPARVWTDPVERFVETCKGMLYPRLELQVQSRRAQGNLIGTALVDDRQNPTALSVSYVDKDRGNGEILSFCVRPDLRRQGLGERLLGATLDVLKQQGAERAGLLLRASWHDCAVMERLVVKAGFEPPTPRQIAYRNDLEYFVRSGEDLPQFFPLPEGFEIMPWGDATEEQRAAIRRRQEQTLAQTGRGWYPPTVNPFQLEDSEFSQGPSQAVIKEGAVVGWILCHELKPDTLQYTALFMDPELREGYLAAELIKSVFVRHHESYVGEGKWRYSTFLTDARNQPIRQLIDVYFRPFNPEVTELRWTSKELVPAN